MLLKIKPVQQCLRKGKCRHWRWKPASCTCVHLFIGKTKVKCFMRLLNQQLTFNFFSCIQFKCIAVDNCYSADCIPEVLDHLLSVKMLKHCSVMNYTFASKGNRWWLTPANEVAGRWCFQSRLSIILFMEGGHITVTHDASDLTVQVPWP